jgi:hypothetical protein
MTSQSKKLPTRRPSQPSLLAKPKHGHIETLKALLRELETRRAETDRLIREITAQIEESRARTPARPERRRWPRKKPEG